MVKVDYYSYYKDRVNTSYQEYFNSKYFPFLLHIITYSPKKEIIDLGCGIASVGKALSKIGGIRMYKGVDCSKKMIRLAKKNYPEGVYEHNNILDMNFSLETVVSHGVLEHFNNEEITDILETFPFGAHYVPSSMYKFPSIGDERLLSIEEWKQIIPDGYQIISFNNGYDLIISSLNY